MYFQCELITSYYEHIILKSLYNFHYLKSKKNRNKNVPVYIKFNLMNIISVALPEVQPL